MAFYKSKPAKIEAMQVVLESLKINNIPEVLDFIGIHRKSLSLGFKEDGTVKELSFWDKTFKTHCLKNKDFLIRINKDIFEAMNFEKFQQRYVPEIMAVPEDMNFSLSDLISE